MHYKETEYGFEYGAATVERWHSDHKQGWVYMSVKSPKQAVHIYVTKTGKIRVYKYKVDKNGYPVGDPTELKDKAE